MTTRLKIAGGAAAPFSSDPEYIDAELNWLKTRVARIVAERQLRDAQEEESDGDPAYARRPGRLDSREARCRVVELKDRELQLRQEIDERLDLHRQERGAPTLGLDEICREYDLVQSEERLILLACLPLGVSQYVAEKILGDLLHHWGSISVADCISVLDPKSTSDWLRFRRLFRVNAPLIQHGLIEVSRHSGEPGPDTLMCADIRLTLTAFARIVGDPDAMTEGD